jgi:hypothetical protein
MVTGVPPHMTVPMVYPVNVNATATGSWASYTFSLNNLVDPDITGVGSQPTTFDQWMTLYMRFRVLAVHVDLDVADGTSSAGGSRAVAIVYRGSDIPTESWMGYAGTRDAIIPTFAHSGFCGNVSQTFYIKDVAGLTEAAVLADDGLQGSSSTTPSITFRLGIGCATGGGATDVVRIRGLLRYVVRLECPVANNISALASLMPKPLAPIASIPVAEDRTGQKNDPAAEAELIAKILSLLRSGGTVTSSGVLGSGLH